MFENENSIRIQFEYRLGKIKRKLWSKARNKNIAYRYIECNNFRDRVHASRPQAVDRQSTRY